MAMSRPQPVSVMLVASTSAALHGGVTVLSVPILSFLLLCWGGTPVLGREGTWTETAMVLAVLAPLAATAFGFAVGGMMAWAHNVFARSQRRLSVAPSETKKTRTATLGSAA